MELRTEKVRIAADFERGVQLIEAPGIVETRIGPIDHICRFVAHDNVHLLAKTRPDAVLNENGNIQVVLAWRGAESAQRVVVLVEFRLSADGEGVLVRGRVTNELSAAINLDYLDLITVQQSTGGKFALGFSAGEWSVLRHGWQSWSATRTFRLIERDPRPRMEFIRIMEENPANPSSNKRGIFNSEQLLALRNVSSGQAALFGFLTGARAFGDLRLEIDPKSKTAKLLRARCHFDGLPVEPGQTVYSEELLIRFGGRGQDLIEKWANLSGQMMKARVPAKSPAGWCSWYYYYTKITEADLIANLELLAPLREELKLEFFQLDDGYQSAIGDWLSPNQKFPSGLAALAQRIRSAGFIPGIWTAPFLADQKSQLVAEHPDWLLRNDKGKPVRGAYNPLWYLWRGFWTLDPTHPEVLAWLEQTFRTLREMGWDMFKIDFLYAAAYPARRHDPSLSRAGALRAGLEAIRRGIGPDAYLLGCGCPLGPAVGLVDAMRIGPDVMPRWTNPMRWLLRDHHCMSTRHAVRNTIHRAFLHQTWWNNDPDCVLVREKKNRLTVDEIRTFASLAAISGGLFLISDDTTKLPPERLTLLRTALKARTHGMRVLDPDVGEFPTKLLARIPEGYLLLVINYRKEEDSPIFDLKEVLDLNDLARLEELQEVWLNKTLLQHDGLIRLGNIPPHGCRLIKIRLREAADHHA